MPHSENHDFTYLTGLEGLNSLDSALLLLPTPDKQWAVLYTSADVQVIKTVTGIEDVRPYARLEEDSVGRTDRLPRHADYSGAAMAAAGCPRQGIRPA